MKKSGPTKFPWDAKIKKKITKKKKKRVLQSRPKKAY